MPSPAQSQYIKKKKKKQENNTWAKWGYQRRETKNVTNSGAAEIQ